MAGRDSPHPKRKVFLAPPSILLLALVGFVTLLLLFTHSSDSSVFSQTNSAFDLEGRDVGSDGPRSCDYSDGKWIYDPDAKPKYDNTCKEIFKGWNCISGKKANGWEIVKWRWKAEGCDLRSFDPLTFLERYRNTNIGFVGDSLNRNMFVSLFCSLRQVSSEVKKWRPAAADRGFTFLKYNLTIAYHRTNLLARYGGPRMKMVVPWSL